jgi:N,N'-diacetylchitobiose phosphorylase
MNPSSLTLISNGRYNLWLPAGSGGFSRCDGLALADWNLDALESYGGWSLFLRDDETGDVASFGATASLGGTEWHHVNGAATITLHLLGVEVAIEARVHASQNVELRRITLRHEGPRARRLTLVTAMPVALNWPDAQAGHPAFARLFVQTRQDPITGALSANRRPRANGETWPSLHGGLEGEGNHGWDTDRARFQGRGTRRGRPRGVVVGLSQTAGNVLDPVFAVSRSFRLAPGDHHRLCSWLELVPAANPVVDAPPVGQQMAVQALATPAGEWSTPLTVGQTTNADGLPVALVRDLLRAPAGVRAASQWPSVVASVTGTQTQEDLLLWNGTGGFSADGREYVIRIPAGAEGPSLPPMPWINVMANAQFGTLISDTGSACTWSVNSHQHRVTPWYNDPVRDPHGEAFYVRDLDSGECWSPQAGPMQPTVANEVRHGWGYSEFLQVRGPLEQRLTTFVHATDTVKFTRLCVSNQGNCRQRLRVYGFSRLVLGFHPALAPGAVDVQVDADRHCLFATRRDPNETGRRHAFATLIGPTHAWQGGGSRQAFLGDGGCIDAPWAVMSGERWGDAVMPDDAAFVQSADVEIDPGCAVTLTFMLGDAATETERDSMLAAFADDAAVQTSLAQVKALWTSRLTVIQVKTPEPAIDVMLNGWLLYQTLSCRMLGRTALYQSSGAFGFRDQLQDSLAFLNTQPQLTRQQILLHASRQFVEGDVQHWWHEPPLDRGLRTRFSDDLNWLPLAVASYVDRTGDAAILDTMVCFLEGPLLHEGEDERYDRATVSERTASLYEHCCLALDRSLAVGPHGLPLMGTGDWNDGMNRIGRLGVGESVWMGFFLHDILGRMLPLCRAQGDAARVSRYEAHRDHLFSTLNDVGWDGEWYRRAWYDNGHVVGSRESDECRIDALAQAWSILSGVATGDRVDRVLASLDEHLIDSSARIVRLLTPPFADTPDDPGYIKGYVAGVRENGGQYTHAAAWVVKAFAAARRHQRVADLFLATLPAIHAATPDGVDRLKTEPYVAVADVYGSAPHVGRGGWSWYTGSSGWLQRVGIESLLGLRWTEGDTLVVNPCIPDEWPGFEAVIRHGAGLEVCLSVTRTSPGGSEVLSAQCNGTPLSVGVEGVRIPCAGQSGRCDVVVSVGARSITQ